MIILNNKKANGMFPLSYLFQSNSEVCHEVYDYLITDGAVEEFMSDCRAVDYIMCDSREATGVEVFKVVEITDASYTIIQKVRNNEVKIAIINTLLKSEDKVDKLVKMADKIYREGYDKAESVRLVKIRGIR